MWAVEVIPKGEVSAQYLYDLSSKHRLVIDNLPDAIDRYRAVSPECAIFLITEADTGHEVAQVVVSGVIAGDSANIDFIPQPSYFAPGSDYEPHLRKALKPLLAGLMDLRQLNRIQSFVPKSRSRTVRALRSCGFVKEGVMRDAITLSRGLENVVVMGLLPEKEQS